jgi:GT2 family glycosyltransferase
VPNDISVVICAYTMDRWDLLVQAVASVTGQGVPPLEVILCVDHNRELFERSRIAFAGGQVPVLVLENRHDGRLGSARNTAVEAARGELIAFLDDDAAAAPDWLEKLQGVYAQEPTAMVVGGAPLPRYARPKPAWFPEEFLWVFGCAYKGLPATQQPVRHVIGACMSARRDALLEVGGFHSDNHDDMDLCHRVAHRFGPQSVLYDPAIRVSHFVGAERVTWSYFWHRCHDVNRGKVTAFMDMEEAGNIRAELAFALRSMFVTVPRYLFSRQRGGVARAGATIAGLALAATGHVRGRIDHYRGKRVVSLTRGIGGEGVGAVHVRATGS